MLLNQQRFAFMGSSFALTNEIDRYVRLYMQTRDYDYLSIPVSALAKEITVTPKEIDAYYSQHQNEFMSPEQVSVEYVTLSMSDIRSKIKITDDDISKYYSENQSNYLTPAQWKVAHILFAVPESASNDEKEEIKKKADEAYEVLQKNPERFDKLVALSDDKLSITEKGILPWMTAGQSEYNKILSPLTTVGQISAPEETKHGFEIFKLVDYKPVTTKTLAEMKSTIEEQLSTDLVQAQYAQALEQLSDLSYQTPDSLAPVADALGLKVKQSKPFSRITGTDELGKNKLIVNSAFSNDVLGLGNNSEPVQLNNDAVVVLRVKDHFVSKKLPLTKVEDQIKSTLVKTAAEAKAKELGAVLLTSTEDKKQHELIAAHHLKWTTVEQATRDGDKANSQINDLAFNLLRADSRDGVPLDNGDYVVVRLKQINDGSLSTMDKEQKESLIQQVEANYGVMDYDLYVNSLINQAKLEKQ
jgi:peptidyl-prolyl cis-trans isomerase D